MMTLSEALQGNLRDYAMPQGVRFAERNAPFESWVAGRMEHQMWPYTKRTVEAPLAESVAFLEDGTRMQGVNFASQDYLSLSSHPRIKEAAKRAIDEYGVHSAGSSALMGNTRYSKALEERIAAFLGYAHALIYPTGWGAGFGVVRGLVRPHDHIVADVYAHACLREGMHTATSNIVNVPHLDNGKVREALREIRAKDARGAILVITESLFSMDSDTPDIGSLQEACRAFDATLLVDCAHDLGAIGPGGRGFMGLQGMVGKADIVMGSFSKTFASNGGFVAMNSSALRQVLRTFSGPQTFSNAMSPVQCATVLEAFDIVDSPEGDQRRRRLMDNIEGLRAKLSAAGFKLVGEASPIVPVLLDNIGVQRLTAREVLKHPILVNFAEFPAVPIAQPRARLQVMCDHGERHIDTLVASLAAAHREACAVFARLGMASVPDAERGPRQLRVG